MSFWGLVQIFVDFILLTAVGFMWVRLGRPAKDDPRLSRGLQLLQSKISVLEDLSDRTEVQVTQLTTLIEQKCRDIQATIHLAEKQVQKIEASMSKSLEVAKIFQDKIPHQEIIERQNTIKYVKAARMAHQGVSIDEIAAQVDLSRGEIEFIAKVNKDNLQFSEVDLPEWAKEEALAREVQTPTDLMEPIFQKSLSPQSFVNSSNPSDQTLSHLGEKFRQAFDSNVPQNFVGNLMEPTQPFENIKPTPKMSPSAEKPVANQYASQSTVQAVSQSASQPTSQMSSRATYPSASASSSSTSTGTAQAQMAEEQVPSELMKRVNAAKKNMNPQYQPTQQRPISLNTGDVRKVVFPKIEVNNNLG